MRDLSGKVAVVTGAGSGIGRALAQHFAAAGCHLALCDLDAQGLGQTAASIQTTTRVTTARVDVASEPEMEAFAAQVKREHGRADVLVNNAGVGLHGTFEQISNDDLRWLMGINFYGVVYGTRAFLPLLLAQERANLVNISSVFGLIAPAGQTAYCAAKFAVKGFTESLRHEYAGSRLAITVVHPGGIKTQIATRSRAPRGFDASEAARRAEHFNRLAARTSSEQAARLIVRAVQKDQPRLLIGTDAHLLDRIARNFPQSYWSLLGKVMDPGGWFRAKLPPRAG
jgi:NAD(P)-dependent dehydrogenase (short-subunit alcohol dehydrogenase family)